MVSCLLCALKDWIYQMLVLSGEGQADILASLCRKLKNRHLILKTIFIRELSLMFLWSQLVWGSNN